MLDKTLESKKVLNTKIFSLEMGVAGAYGFRRPSRKRREGFSGVSLQVDNRKIKETLERD